MTTCPVCIENLTVKSTVVCYIKNCAYTTCKKCVQTYLLNTALEPHCMNCRSKWGTDFIIKALGQTFITSTYKTHRATILADKCIAKKEEYLENALLYRENITDKELCDALNKETAELRAAYQRKYDELERTRRRISRRNNILSNTEFVKTEKRVFTMPCQTNDCRGMLDTNYFCLLCAKTTCKMCFTVMEPNHVCNEDSVASATMIKTSSKPCPKCGTRISKIDGCDQMWCVECKTAFSWTRGTIEKGAVHNPHYYQWLREGGNREETAADEPPRCGQPDFDKMIFCFTKIYYIYGGFEVLLETYPDNTVLLKLNALIEPHRDIFKNAYAIAKKITEMISYAHHIDQVALPHLRHLLENQTENHDAIYMYIIGNKSREELGQNLVSIENEVLKINAFIDIYTATHLVLNQVFNTIDNNISNGDKYCLQHLCKNMEFSVKNPEDYNYRFNRVDYHKKIITNLETLFNSKIKQADITYTFVSVVTSLIASVANNVENVEKYLAYSNVEQIKLLIAHNSKKRIDLWDFEKSMLSQVTFTTKSEMLKYIEKYSAMM